MLEEVRSCDLRIERRRCWKSEEGKAAGNFSRSIVWCSTSHLVVWRDLAWGGLPMRRSTSVESSDFLSTSAFSLLGLPTPSILPIPVINVDMKIGINTTAASNLMVSLKVYFCN